MRLSTTNNFVVPPNLYKLDITREKDLTLDWGLVTWKVTFGYMFETTYILAILKHRQLIDSIYYFPPTLISGYKSSTLEASNEVQVIWGVNQKLKRIDINSS